MTARTPFAAELDRAGLRQVDLVRLVRELAPGHAPQLTAGTVNRWCAGTRHPPAIAVAAVRLFAELPGWKQKLYLEDRNR